MLESDLFDPVKKLFQDLGYQVNGEVLHCDLTANRDGHLIIVELKRNLSVELLSQGVNRQKIGADVYVAVPKPKHYTYAKWKDIFYLLKKLELGLIFVTDKKQESFAQVIQEPVPFNGTRVSKLRKNSIMKEIEQRKLDCNKGGSVRTKLATAYREKSIHIACLLEHYDKLSPKQLKLLGSDEKSTNSILYKNFYGWFDRVEKGVYKLSDSWEKDFVQFQELVTYYRALVKRTVDLD